MIFMVFLKGNHGNHGTKGAMFKTLLGVGLHGAKPLKWPCEALVARKFGQHRRLKDLKGEPSKISKISKACLCILNILEFI